MARTKKTVVSGITREQAEQAFADFAAADAKVQNLTSKMDIEMTRIREKYADQLAELSATKEKNFDIMQAYAVENKEELFSKRKSLESAHGVFGFRTGTPKLKNLKGFTWAAVTNICKELLPQYIRTTDELAKDKLLADRDNPKVAEFFPKIGVQVVQEETFYVEPQKRERCAICLRSITNIGRMAGTGWCTVSGVTPPVPLGPKSGSSSRKRKPGVRSTG